MSASAPLPLLDEEPDQGSEGAIEPRPQATRDASWYFNLGGLLLIHGAAVWAVFRAFSWELVTLCAATYFVRMFAITGVYHRYFSHRTFKTGRTMQFLLALLGTTATQKGPLWWAGNHRLHHKHSDTEKDLHSPKQRGFLYSHMGWWLGREHEGTPEHVIRDFAKYPELVFLNRFHWIGSILLIGFTLGFGALTGIGAFDSFLWGFCLSTALVLHGTFTINSLAHVVGSRRFATSDTSRNNFWLALITLGEGWHNNHHHYQSCANQGFYWWEIDVTFYVLWTMEKVGLISDLRRVPPQALSRNRIGAAGE